MKLWRHIKRKTVYVELHRAELQTGDKFADGTPVVVYQSIDNHNVYVRPVSEFEDGRFELVGPN